MPPHLMVLRISRLPDLYLPLVGVWIVLFLLAVVLLPLVLVIWCILRIKNKHAKMRGPVGLFSYAVRVLCELRGSSFSLSHGDRIFRIALY